MNTISQFRAREKLIIRWEPIQYYTFVHQYSTVQYMKIVLIIVDYTLM